MCYKWVQFYFKVFLLSHIEIQKKVYKLLKTRCIIEYLTTLEQSYFYPSNRKNFSRSHLDIEFVTVFLCVDVISSPHLCARHSLVNAYSSSTS